MTITGKTKSGFAFAVEKDVVDDMELIDDLAEADDGDPLAISKVCKRVLGADQRKRLYDHLRKDGRVPIKDVAECIIEIFAAMGQEGKN